MTARPLFTITRGRPDEHEIAALTTVLLTVLRTPAAGPDTAGTDARAPGGRGPLRRRPGVSWTAR